MFPLHRHLIGRTTRAVIAWAVLIVAGPSFALDFNGDHVADMLFRDHTRPENRIVIALGKRYDPDGGARRVVTLSTRTDRQLGFDVRTGDFDGDGKTDLLDRDLESGAIRVRLMNGTTIRGEALLQGPPRSPGEKLYAVADFDGDGRDDLLTRTSLTGVWNIWLLNGLGVKLASSGPTTLARYGWLFAGTADFNGDGRSDLLLHSSDTEGWRMIQLAGRETRNNSPLDFLPDGFRWHLEAIRDMNHDGRADLLFRDRDTGIWQTYFMAGASRLPESGRTAINEGLDWRLQLLEDLNGDGYPDALLARYDTSEWRVDFLMNRYRLAGSGVVNRTPDPAARIAAAADYNGDGMLEVLVSHPGGWRLLELDNPAAPGSMQLAAPRPKGWSRACEPPRYQQYVRPGKPGDLGADSAFLTWKSPVSRQNGEALCPEELAGFDLRYARTSGGAVHSVRILNPKLMAREIASLAAGKWWFKIMTVDSNGRLSPTSEPAFKLIP